MPRWPGNANVTLTLGRRPHEIYRESGPMPCLHERSLTRLVQDLRMLIAG